MADYNAELIQPFGILQASPTSIEAELIDGGTVTPVVTYQYLMVWSDTDCGSPTARFWYATFEDTTGTEYAGPKCGATPITGASVLKRIITG